jgi:hypothetical protein
MAKVRFYCDIYPGQHPQFPLHATTVPYGEKMKNARRLAFDVMIPDTILVDLDIVSPEPALMTVVEDRQHD